MVPEELVGKHVKSRGTRNRAVSNPKKAAYALRNAVGLMEERLRVLAERKVRNIESYNHHLAAEAKARGEVPALMTYLVIVIDELADLMILAQSEVEDSITRLAQLSRAVGMHLVIATQRPSTNVITGMIEAMEKAGLIGPADGAKPRKILARRNYDGQ